MSTTTLPPPSELGDLEELEAMLRVDSDSMNPRYLRLLELYQRDGKLTAGSVVKEAKKKRSPLHGHFEWDDDVAAHEYRLTQARHLIRTFKVRVVKSGSDGESRQVRAIVHEPETDSYVPIGVVYADEERREAMRQRLYSELIGLQRRIKAYEVFDGVVDAIDEIELP